MKNKLRLSVLMFSLICMLMLTAMQAYAASSTEETSGSLSLSYRYNGSGIDGLTVRIYEAGYVGTDGSFVLSDNFSASGISLDGLTTSSEWKAAAVSLISYATENQVPETGETKSSADGAAVFAKLSPALYLISTDTLKTGSRTYTFDPFLISIPGMEDGKTVYDLTASPKCEVTTPGGNTPGGGGNTPGHSTTEITQPKTPLGPVKDVPVDTIPRGNLPITGQEAMQNRLMQAGIIILLLCLSELCISQIKKNRRNKIHE